MPFHNPISNDPRKDGTTGPGQGRGQSGSQSGGMKSLVQAEKLVQIAFVLPCAMVVGWAMGWGVDHLLHSHWATFAGLVLGIISGMVTVIRMAMNAMNDLGKTERTG
jgi:ATP synthase protein I